MVGRAVRRTLGTASVENRIQFAFRFLPGFRTGEEDFHVDLLIRIRRRRDSRSVREIDDGQHFAHAIGAIRAGGMQRRTGVKRRIAGANRLTPDRPCTFLDDRCQTPIGFRGDDEIAEARRAMGSRREIIEPICISTSTSGSHIVIVRSVSSGQ